MRLIALLYFIISISPLGHSQDIHFSNWSESPLISAAAITGNFTGNYRILGNFRNQWRSVTTPYKTTAISADAREFIPTLTQLKAGISLARDITGDSRWNTTHAQCVLSYEITWGEKFTVSPLIGTGIIQQRYSNENLQYDQQWNGTYYDPSLLSGENFTPFNNNYLQFTHGISAEIIEKESATTLGYSMQLNTSNKNTSGHGSMRSSRTTIIGLHQHKLNDIFSIEPSIQIHFQQNYRSILPGIKLYRILETGSWHHAIIQGGLKLRIADAIIPNVGVQYDQWIGGMSYDINLSKLKVASNGRGSFEMYIGTIINKLPKIEATPYCRPLY